MSMVMVQCSRHMLYGFHMQVYGVGDQVWVKVVDIQENPGNERAPYKIGCSIKLVSQADGGDLDPGKQKNQLRNPLQWSIYD